MTPEDERRARRVDNVLRRLGIQVAPRKIKRRDAGPVMDDGRSITRSIGFIKRVR